MAAGSSHSSGIKVAMCWPRDTVAGVPAEYGAAIIDNTLSVLATITTTEELMHTWHP